ncbi:MAG: carboxypeptidase-like regulatory domain-containing protein, partial [Paludibacteraceae bacterium]|nr:carboxypeptidase-like regulatory domain-containing protein [Paludibacteraceae bacterium]
MLKRSFILVCIVFLCSFVEAQKKVYVRGYVLDEKQQAVELATVFEQNQLQGTTSNSSGFYELMLEKSDTFCLTFSCIGHQSVEKKITSQEQFISLNITLNTDVTELETVEIKSLHRQISTMQKIDPKNMKLIPDISGGSIESLLSTFAGVHSTNEMSSQYSVRGGNYDENIVYVNNIEIYRPLLIRAGQQEGLSFINPDLV